MDQAQRDRLDELRELKAKREKDEKDAAELRELEAEELHHKVLADTKGVRGVDFEIVNNPFGVFAIKKPDAQAIANWDRTGGTEKATLEWQIGLLRNYILPDKARGLVWAALAADRPGLCWQTGEAFLAMMGVAKDEKAKKS